MELPKYSGTIHPQEWLKQIKSHLQIQLWDILQCFGITQDPNTNNYMMVLFYCNDGNLRNYLNISEDYINYISKIENLFFIARGLLDIHNSGKVHKDFHSDAIQSATANPISDCLDVQLSELDLNEIDQDDENDE
ncbi:hypothetical protein C1645_739468 [Glomus cerebriforme]|uniref:Protein kinase domain-containing protein n=1 Tax=Glomus cerebriforme TaxID=658196 RepID=A0A397STS6_9GLOM|nr:hypothetical protein C1645_739468 [Glomus cerebriforme]